MTEIYTDVFGFPSLERALERDYPGCNIDLLETRIGTVLAVIRWKDFDPGASTRRRSRALVYEFWIDRIRGGAAIDDRLTPAAKELADEIFCTLQ